MHFITLNFKYKSKVPYTVSLTIFAHGFTLTRRSNWIREKTIFVSKEFCFAQKLHRHGLNYTKKCFKNPNLKYFAACCLFSYLLERFVN